jgi:hypothetical protein
MVDERFSMQAFSELGLDTFEARELADLLANEILKEMHVQIEIKMREIIGRLNSMGHHLRLYEESELGDIDYRDDVSNAEDYRCFLRVSHSSVVSTGYAHLYKWKTS